jgi:hypothetical protein
MAGMIGAAWAVAGFSLILIDAINRLSGMALHALDGELTPVQSVALALTITAMAYIEGYRGFQKSFSPRCAARTLYLYQHPDTASVLLAPLFIMGFFRAERRPLLIAWVGTSVIVLLVFALHVTPQPWRGVVDSGVVVGLTWGLLSFLFYAWQVFRSGEYVVSPAVPGGPEIARKRL